MVLRVRKGGKREGRGRKERGREGGREGGKEGESGSISAQWYSGLISGIHYTAHSSEEVN